MYSNKENVNILTALLVGHGIRHVVVCPGSRNAPIVHNLTECPDITCHSVTDERSAGFYALGLSLARRETVAVCVTSGTALLNLAPAVAEASYQHQGIVVISADRPQAWIGQLDGQTLPQPGAFGQFVGKSVNLPEVADEESRWHCGRLVNEALNAVRRGGQLSVHINVPLSEPLFTFDAPQLPQPRVIRLDDGWDEASDRVDAALVEAFRKARRPMIVLGQYQGLDEQDVTSIRQLQQYAVVLAEPLSHPEGGAAFDEVLYNVGDDERFLPDFLLYGGDTVVSKRLRKFLRKGVDRAFEISEDGEIHDTFQCVERVCCANFRAVLRGLCAAVADFEAEQSSAFTQLWQTALAVAEQRRQRFEPEYSQMAAVKLFEQQLGESQTPSVVHYANSTSVRLGNIYARHFVYCNRGVNGIEGSLSTAAGHSLGTESTVYIVIGDLSFFYDSNALWNSCLRENLRILLLNNGGGGIFRQLPVGDGRSAALDSVMAVHQTTAEGLCQSYHVDYLSAHNFRELQEQMAQFMQHESDRPVLLEVFTDADGDTRVYNDYYRGLCTEK